MRLTIFIEGLFAKKIRHAIDVLMKMQFACRGLEFTARFEIDNESEVFSGGQTHVQRVKEVKIFRNWKNNKKSL